MLIAHVDMNTLDIAGIVYSIAILVGQVRLDGLGTMPNQMQHDRGFALLVIDFRSKGGEGIVDNG